MVLKRNWVGGESDRTPKFTYACYGTSSFAILYLTDNVIAEIDFNAAFLSESSVVTPKDLKTLKAKLVAMMPSDGFQWQKNILCFSNLSFLLFCLYCHLHVKVLNILKANLQYKINIMHKLPIHTKASTLWILHFQS